MNSTQCDEISKNGRRCLDQLFHAGDHVYPDAAEELSDTAVRLSQRLATRKRGWVMDDQQCETCRYSVESGQPEPDNGFTLCRRNAPQVVPGTEGPPLTYWPVVSMSDWCGEYLMDGEWAK